MSNLNEFALSKSSFASRSILKNVYLWMALALAVTGITAYAISQNIAAVATLYSSGAIWVIVIAEVVLVFAISGFVMKMHPLVATAIFALYSILNGVSLSAIFLIYDLGSVFKAFFAAGAVFAVMSVYALTTKRSLAGWGHFLFMALIGLLIASVLNLILQSSAIDYLISGIGVVVFTLLTAYDTQQIKEMSGKLGDQVVEADFLRLSIVGALKLYLDFINIFLYLLRLFGSRN